MSINVVEINLGNFGSTGTIMKNIVKTASNYEFHFLQVYPYSPNCKKETEDYIVCSYFWQRVYQKLYFYTGYSDCWNKLGTILLIKKLNKFKPDIIHLHNIHNNYLDLKMLFNYIKKKNIKVVWTLHDCWAFTGRCPYFTLSKCNNWINGCHNCVCQKNDYPATRIDRTKKMWLKKKELFSNIKNMIVVTPSIWLSNLVKESFLGSYPVEVVNNGIDLKIFQPRKSNFRSNYKIDNKYVLLGVSFDWGVRKGLDFIIELSKVLDENYQIVLVGITEELLSTIPENIISIQRTQNQIELAEIYSSADLFINPTREENYPTVNMEALACGIPVLTFNTGGSPEIIDKTCGSVVECEDLAMFKNKIIEICEGKKCVREACLERAKMFNMEFQINKYIDLFRKISVNNMTKKGD